MKKNIFFLLVISLLISCSDSQEDLPIIVGSWEVIKEEVKYPDSEWETSDQECRFDNTEEFEEDGTHILYDGTFDCGESGTGIEYGSWRLAADDTQVIFTYDGYAGEYPKTIEELNPDQMILSYDTGLVSGMQVRTTYSKVK